MIIMQEESKAEKLYTPAEAVEYLREQRGISVTVGGLRQWRNRGFAKIDPERTHTQITLWTKKELDSIQPPPGTNTKRGRHSRKH